MSNSPYDIGLHAWANEQARLLRAGRWTDLDVDNVAEEIESVGRSEARELDSRLEVLLLHLLKWQAQPALAGSSWRATIRVQQRDIARHLGRNPSLWPKSDEAMRHAFANAVIRAADETNEPEEAFPEECPWTLEESLDPGFWP